MTKNPIKEIDNGIEEILATKTVSKAQALMQSKSGLWFLAFASFIESATPFPILTDPFLVAALLLSRKRSVLIVFITVISSVAGGVGAYYTAAFFLEFIVHFMTPDMHASFDKLLQMQGLGTFFLTLAGALTPLPYTSTAYVVAAMKGNILIFILASIIGRGIRYSAVGVLIYYFGPTAMKYAKRYVAITSLVLLALGGFYLWHKFS